MKAAQACHTVRPYFGLADGVIAVKAHVNELSGHGAQIRDWDRQALPRQHEYRRDTASLCPSVRSITHPQQRCADGVGAKVPAAHFLCLYCLLHHGRTMMATHHHGFIRSNIRRTPHATELLVLALFPAILLGVELDAWWLCEL